MAFAPFPTLDFTPGFEVTQSIPLGLRHSSWGTRYIADVADPQPVLPIPLCCRLESLYRWCCRPTACVADPAMLPTRVAISLMLPTHCLCCRSRYVSSCRLESLCRWCCRPTACVADPAMLPTRVAMTLMLTTHCVADSPAMLPTRVAMSLVLPTHCLCCRPRYVADSSRYVAGVADPLPVLPTPLCCRLESLWHWCWRPTDCVADSPAMLPTRVAGVADPLPVLLIPLCCRLESLCRLSIYVADPLSRRPAMSVIPLCSDSDSLFTKFNWQQGKCVAKW